MGNTTKMKFSREKLEASCKKDGDLLSAVSAIWIGLLEDCCKDGETFEFGPDDIGVKNRLGFSVRKDWCEVCK